MEPQLCKARLLAIGVAVLLSSATMASDASATAIGIRFTVTTGLGIIGSDTIDAAPGDMLTAVISVAPDELGVSGYGVSMLFDEDLLDELNLISATELMPAPFMNLTPGCKSSSDSTGAAPGSVNFCEGVTFGLGPVAPDTFDIIEVVFQVTENVATDGNDMKTGFFDPADGMGDNDSNTVIPSFGQAAVNMIPEPSSGLLVGLGLVAALRARRNRESLQH